MISTAYAAEAAAGGPASAQILMLVAMFAIFYFLLIRPQQKKAKEHREMVASLKKGMRVITSGGIHGTIAKVSENTVRVEIAENVFIKVGRGNIGLVLSGNETAKKDDKK